MLELISRYLSMRHRKSHQSQSLNSTPYHVLLPRRLPGRRPSRTMPPLLRSRLLPRPRQRRPHLLVVLHAEPISTRRDRHRRGTRTGRHGGEAFQDRFVPTRRRRRRWNGREGGERLERVRYESATSRCRELLFGVSMVVDGCLSVRDEVGRHQRTTYRRIQHSVQSWRRLGSFHIRTDRETDMVCLSSYLDEGREALLREISRDESVVS